MPDHVSGELILESVNRTRLPVTEVVLGEATEDCWSGCPHAAERSEARDANVADLRRLADAILGAAGIAD